MRILVDLQALQSGSSANRGIGRYSRALIEGMLRNAPEDEFILLFNGMIGEDNDRLRREFAQKWSNVRFRVWTAAPPAGFFAPSDFRQAAEAIREAVIADCAPDIVLVTSLFEGLGDDAVTTVGRTPTAVVLYDLIPHIFPDLYQSDPNTKKWYQTKVDALKGAGLLLAISESAAKDGRTHLGLQDGRITNISSDVDGQFVPQTVDQTTRDTLARDLGLTRPFLMYTGGLDHRKNIPALISAFASLPKHVIADHQLAIICRASDAEKAKLLAHAQASGLPEGSVVMTGYVSDKTLVTLYNACAAFIFPSWYEGFGLPVLEAMRCGAAVIGANTSSVPEVIGREDALFDPKSTSDMARMIEKVLTEKAFHQSLREFAPVQAARFSWDDTARRALAALRQLVNENGASKPAVEPTVGKPRLAFVSPMPPERSGISYYSAELLPVLAEHYEIDLIVSQDTVAETVDQSRFPVRNVQWLRDHPQHYDRVVYQFGNSTFHTHMFDLLAEIPGVVVLHDFFLSDIERCLDPQYFTRLLAENHGYHAVLERYNTAGARDGLTEAVQSWPANARAVRPAQGVIVHSEHARVLASRFYDPSTVVDWTAIPLLRVSADVSEEARAKVRKDLGIAQDELLICSFGHLTINKLPSHLIDGLLLSASAENPKVHLAFVGDGGDLGPEIMSRISGSSLKGRVQITGWVSDDLYQRYLQAADLAIQLRSNSRGESSAAVLDCQNYGLPVVVNAHGSLADLPEDTVLRISDTFSDLELAEAIDRLVSDSGLRSRIGSSARKLVVEEHAPNVCGRAYRDAIEAYYSRHQGSSGNLIARLAQLPVNEARDARLFQATADSLPSAARLRQLLVDVSELVQRDANSGVQRVARAILSEWLRHPPPGCRVEPVFADPGLGRYRYARRFTCSFLGIPDDWAKDLPIDFFSDDQFVGLDLQPELVPQMHASLSAMAASGVRIAFVVYDLLPVRMPQHFKDDVCTEFANWLQAISRYERLICISCTVADELRAYLNNPPPANGLMPDIGWFHLGADLESATTKAHQPGNDNSMLEGLVLSRPSFLMVGTIEPRKGHALALDAFDRFWSEGGDATLVIAGKQGWKVDALCARLRKHPESGKRLIWLDKATDAQLQQLYSNCSCLIAASEGEGFGLPLIEAARHDLPILARDIPVFREVAGEYAWYFDGSSPDNLRHALESWLVANRAGNVPRSGELRFLTWRESAAALLLSLGVVGAMSYSPEIGQ
jgi:glycosyltransferase involved in cell wall biosynthesis